MAIRRTLATREFIHDCFGVGSFASWNRFVRAAVIRNDNECPVRFFALQVLRQLIAVPIADSDDVHVIDSVPPFFLGGVFTMPLRRSV